MNMYNKVECVSITCDSCNTLFEDSYSDFSIFQDFGYADEQAQEDGWHVTDDGKHYCPKCHTIDEEDNLIVTQA